MRIGINARFLLSGKIDGFGRYSEEVIRRLVEMHPEDEFILFFDRPYDSRFIFGKNVTPVVLGPPARHPLLFLVWFEWSIRRALKKHKVDLFFSPDGYLSLLTNTPQVGVIHDINFEHYPKDLPFTARHYLRTFFPKFARKAAHVVTVSEYSRQDIIQTYGISPEKVSAFWNSASDDFRPLEANDQLLIRKKYTNGKPYFLFVGTIHPRKNIARLIEAFCAFKQETNSDVQLVIVGVPLWGNFGFTAPPKEIETQIHFTGRLSQQDLSHVMAAAKLFVYVPYFEGFGIPLVEAMKCGTPILSGDKTALPEVGGDAVVYCDPFDTTSIVAQMVALHNDQAALDMLGAKGLERSKLFSWDNTAKEIYRVIEEASYEG
jgi:glycosyltransferase involved in cell wall biosynthesis